jgi:hypothetical protein
LNVCGDYENGAIYALDSTVYTDNGTPIQRIRAFPHMVNDLKRVSYKRFVADMSVGDGAPAADTMLGSEPMAFLRCSDDRGATYGSPVGQSMGAQGQKITSMQWRRLGMARDRVFELAWASPNETALNGAFIDVEQAAS